MQDGPQVPDNAIVTQAPCVSSKASVQRRRRKRGGPEFATFEETARFFRVIKSIRDRAIFELVYHAGLRASEVGLLDMRDYDPRTGRIFVHRVKGSNSGEHHMMREESRAFRAHLKARGTGPGCIFPSRKHSPISRDQIAELHNKYAAAAEWPEKLRHPHVWKHTCCTHLRAMGKSVEDIQDWVGHVNIQNSLLYSHMTAPGRGQMAKSLEHVWR